MALDGSARTQIATLVVATSIVQLANGFFGTLFSLRVAIEGFRRIRYSAKRLLWRLHLRCIALRQIDRANWTYSRVCGICRAGCFRDCLDALVSRTPRLDDFSDYDRFRLCGNIRHHRKLAECKGVAGRAWAHLFDIYGRDIPGSRIGPAFNSPSGYQSCGAFQCNRRYVCRGIGNGQHSRADLPRSSATTVLPYGVLTRVAPIAVAGCGVSGVVGGTFYALVPAWMQDQGTDRTTIALFMLIAVLGGFAFQIPIGRLSDRFDRRVVLAFLSLGFAATPWL